MSIDQNKAVVRRFITEVLAGGNMDLIDELLAPNYSNRTMGTDLAGFKAMLAGMKAAITPAQIEDLVAEGDAVVARFTFEMIDANEKKIPVRCLTYYRLADGRIAEDEPITTPDLSALMALPVPAPS